jgi:hypothetical protein
MPKSPIRYENIIIYGLRRKKDHAVCLYDFTTRPASRKWSLKTKWETATDDSSEFVREAGGWSAVEYFLVKKFPCTCGLDALLEVNKMMFPHVHSEEESALPDQEVVNH